jgi:hypothetical protein
VALRLDTIALRDIDPWERSIPLKFRSSLPLGGSQRGGATNVYSPLDNQEIFEYYI